MLGAETGVEYCQLRVKLDIRKPLCRGIFISSNEHSKVWPSFKYENLPIFCFHCGKLGHGVKDCSMAQVNDNETPMENFPYSVALRADSSFFGKESLKYGFSSKKPMTEFYYEGDTGIDEKGDKQVGDGASPAIPPVIDDHLLERNDLGNLFPKMDQRINASDLEDHMEGISAIIGDPLDDIDKSKYLKVMGVLFIRKVIIIFLKWFGGDVWQGSY